MRRYLYFKKVEERVGKERIRVAPDVYVVFGIPKGLRRVYYLWEEKRPPNVVFEVSSRDTKRDDLGAKKDIYESMGVKEYFHYDPDKDPVKWPLKGLRLKDGIFEPIIPEADGSLLSQELNLKFRLNEFGRIRAFNVKTGEEIQRLPEAKKAAEARARMEAARARMEVKAREKYEVRALAEAEARARSDERARIEEARATAEAEARARSDERARIEETRATAEAEARQQAEAEIARLREEIARLKKQ